MTHRPPQGHAVLWAVAEVVGFKRVPEGEDDGGVVSPLEVHLRVCVVEADPELLHICQAEKTQVTWRQRRQQAEKTAGRSRPPFFTVPVMNSSSGSVWMLSRLASIFWQVF